MSAIYRLSKSKCAHIVLNNPPVNAMGLAVRQTFVKGLKQAAEDGARALVLRGANGLFTGGADIVEFTKGTHGQRPHLHDMIYGVEQMKMPVATFLEGTTMGGGVEISLASHYRLAQKECLMGLPEVHLGLLPGAGGTQRLPRLVGADAAFDIMATGRHVPAEEALALGLVDQLVEATDADLQNAELEDFLMSSSVQDTDLKDRVVSMRKVPGEGVVSEKVHSRSFGGFVAPSMIHTAVDAASRLPFEKGIEYEYKLFDSLMQGSQARALQYLFFASRKFQKRHEAGEVSKEIGPRMSMAFIKGMGALIAEGVPRAEVESALQTKLGLSGKLFKQIPEGALPDDRKDGDGSSMDEDLIVERVAYPVVNEGMALLSEGVTDKPDDIDLTCVHGLGFPSYRGGPLFWAEREVGMATVFEGLKKHGGDDAQVDSLLEAVAESGSSIREEIHFSRGDQRRET